jgi:hypothetical protein
LQQGQDMSQRGNDELVAQSDFDSIYKCCAGLTPAATRVSKWSCAFILD